MKELELQIKETMKAEGIDLIGFASRERFADVDVRSNPFSIFPEGKTVIMVTHDPAMAERADVVIRLKDGRIVA